MIELFINDRIRNRKVTFFNKFALTLRYDSMASSFAFEGYFDPNNVEQKEIYCVGHFHLVTLKHNGELLLSGYISKQTFDVDNTRKVVKISGYSLPGVLETCNIPPTPENYPLQSDGLTLREIVSKLIKPFGLKYIVHGSVSKLMDEAYEKTTAEPTQSIKDYITSLAAQKGIVISNDENGRIVFTKADTTKKPLLDFDSVKGSTIPFTSMSLDYNGDDMHSHIYVIKQASSKGGNAGEAMIRNPFVINSVYRPKVVIQDSGSDIDTDKVARMALSGELKNLTLGIITDRWAVDGKIIKPNNIISVINPSVYLFKKSFWFIEQVDLVGDQEKTTMTLTCSLPEVYNSATPKYLFAGINLH